MRLAVIASQYAAHQVATANALVAGLAAQGDEAQIFDSRVADPLPAYNDFDAVCTWGWRKGSRYRALGKNVLVMERAYVGDRKHWVSLGWNGLNGRAQWPDVSEASRWEHFFAHLIQPAKPPAVPRGSSGYALLMGQVPTDTACRDIDLREWLAEKAGELKSLGWDVRYRPHPQAPPTMGVRGVPASRQALLPDLEGAALAVTFNSNSGVDAALAGVPVVACDEGSMAWPVAAHGLDEEFAVPDRLPWAHRLAWRQWLPEEIADGTAWTHVKGALDAAP